MFIYIYIFIYIYTYIKYMCINIYTYIHILSPTPSALEDTRPSDTLGWSHYPKGDIDPLALWTTNGDVCAASKTIILNKYKQP